MKKSDRQSKRDRFPSRPPEPEQLLASIKAIFPEFGKGLVAQDSLHSVMQHFAVYFGTNKNDFSERQIRLLGSLIDEAVAAEDVLENAVSTCLLEHLRQIDGYKTLSPYLSKKAKERTHA